MNFDFRQITGVEDSKQTNFSSLCSRLVMTLFQDAKPVEGRGGDQGIDTFIGFFNGVCQAFQHKYFIDGLKTTQRRQTESSLATASSHHELKRWTLMLPIDLNPSELKWFQKLSAKYTPLEMDWWGKTKLQELLAKSPEIARDFQPTPTVVMVIVNRQIDIRNVSANRIAEILNEALGEPGSQQQRPEDVLMAIAAEIKSRTRLTVLLWGPGPSGDDIYKKRCELKDQLRNLGHQADFSEDICSSELRSAGGLNLSVTEFFQAKTYDYIVCLMASPGSIGEVHDFAKHRMLAAKMMICIDRRYKDGYGAQGAIRIFEGLNGKLDWFESPTDVNECHLATRILDQIQKVAEMKQWAIATREILS